MKKQKCSILVIAISYIFCFLASSHALVMCLTQEEIFLDKTDLNLHIHKNNPAKIAVGPIYGKFFLSDDSGEQFKVVASFSDENYDIFGKSDFKELYEFSFATDSLILNFRKNNVESFKTSSLSEFVYLLGWSNSLGLWRYGKIDFLKPQEINPIIFALVMIFFPFLVSNLINKKIEIENRRYFIWQTLFYFTFIFFLTLFAIPQFREIYDSMSTYRFSESSLCFITSWSSFYGLIINTIAFGVLSPTIFMQLRHFLKKQNVTYLYFLWTIIMIFIVLVWIPCTYFPFL